jgi:transcriptional regulator GlxA family with amidase domain
MNLKTQAAIAFMEANLNRKLFLDDLTRSLGISRWHICHLFQAETGMSPMQYLKILRMQKACKLLETSLLSVKEITAKTGFRDVSHFTRDFKKAHGITPTKHRARFIDIQLLNNHPPRQNHKIGQKTAISAISFINPKNVS